MNSTENKAGGVSAFSALTISDNDFNRLVKFVQSNYGIDLSQKKQLITGRLSSPLKQRGYQNFTDFVNHVLQTKDNDLITLLLDKLTTNYTFFMREKEHLDLFCQKIIPDIVQRHQKDKTLAIWSAGCSTGEEPYNITMFLFDYLGAQAAQWDTRLLATDISNRAMTAAKKGVYELPDTIPPEWKKKYFVPQAGGQYQVAPKVRDNVIFQPFNLMDPIHFRRKFDVIFCRNVMIYFDQPTKDALVKRFYDATVPGGYLLISKSENLSANAPYRRLAPSTFQK
ncbi:MAG: protein-glutamate O-methyltransferase CheR [Oscillospiraceae bacterium]|jgi:chemotaxis protein methyltransferase CheR|nr:protein-glutamate O-methyltransferase CheR [Oscillospiraceae bacterium]